MDGSQFLARFISDAIHPVGAAIPVAGVAQIALDLMQDGMNPRGGGVVFIMLDDGVRRVPMAGQRQFNRPEEIFF